MKKIKTYGYKHREYAPCIKKEEYTFENLKNTTKYDEEDKLEGLEIEVFRTELYPNLWLTRSNYQRRKPTDEEMKQFHEKRLKNKYMSGSDTIEAKRFVWCPYCNTIEETKNTETWKDYEAIKICSHCGKKRHVTINHTEQKKPDKAIIYYMADGSKAISFLYTENSIFCHQEKGTLNVKAYVHRSKNVTRIIISPNGRTYYKHPVNLTKTGKSRQKLNAYKTEDNHMNTPLIKDITYRWAEEIEDDKELLEYAPFFKSNIFYAIDRWTIRAIRDLKQRGIIDIFQEKIDNRFRKLNLYKHCMMNILFNRENIDIINKNAKLHKKVKNMIGKVKPDMTDEEALKAILTHLKLANCGKQIKKYFLEDPFFAGTCYIIFKTINCKDVNNFYKFYDKIKEITKEKGNSLSNNVIYNIYPQAENQYYCDNEEEIKDIIKNYISKAGENNVMKILTNVNNNNDISIYRDTLNNITTLLVDFEYKFMDYKPSLNKTHEIVLNMVREKRKQSTNIKHIEKVLNLHKRIHEATNKTEKQALINKNMNNIEPMINNEISYTKEEQKLEGTFNQIEFFLPKDTDYMKTAGKILHNCVGENYSIPALHKESTIVIMRNDDKLTGCIEIKSHKIRQAFGPCNQKFKKQEQRAYDEWIKFNKDFIRENKPDERALGAEREKRNFTPEEYEEKFNRFKETYLNDADMQRRIERGEIMLCNECPF